MFAAKALELGQVGATSPLLKREYCASFARVGLRGSYNAEYKLSMGTKKIMKPRILFFGTPEFAVVCLQELHKRAYPIVGVVTSPDRPAGRGKKIKISAVKEYAISQDLNLLQPSNLKDVPFLKTLEKINADVAVIVAFRMLPKAVWSLPKQGTFNLHASLLPKYRGAAPINWALVNGEKQTGVTTFFIDEKIDTGALLLQESIPIQKDDTAGSIHDRLAVLGSKLIVKTLEKLQAGQLSPKVQKNNSSLSQAPKLNKENTKIPWHLPLIQIQNFVRGMSPYPGAWSEVEDGDQILVMKLFEVSISIETHQAAFGSIVIDNKKIKIAHSDGWIVCLQLQMPNKRRMSAKDLLNGYHFNKKSRVIVRGF